MHVIGLMGAEQSGKSTTAKFLRENGFKTASFAGPLKRMLGSGLGLSWEQLYGSKKHIPTPRLCGQTPRHAMQTLGTEWGRDRVHGDLWVEALKNDLLGEAKAWPGALFVIEDVRFENEVRAIRELGGEIWLVRRPDVEPKMDLWSRLKRLILRRPLHRSSLGWFYMADPDLTLWNLADQDTFLRHVQEQFATWRVRRQPSAEQSGMAEALMSSSDDAPPAAEAVPPGVSAVAPALQARICQLSTAPDEPEDAQVPEPAEERAAEAVLLADVLDGVPAEFVLPEGEETAVLSAIETEIHSEEPAAAKETDVSLALNLLAGAGITVVGEIQDLEIATSGSVEVTAPSAPTYPVTEVVTPLAPAPKPRKGHKGGGSKKRKK